MKLLPKFVIALVCLIVIFAYIPYVLKQKVEQKKTKEPGDLSQETKIAQNQPANEESTFRKRLPQVISIGVKKCGTGALKTFLGHHPRVKMANVGEPHFFDNNSTFKKGEAFYRSLMPPTEENEITMETTPKYYVTDWVPGRIQRFYGEKSQQLKFIVILCNPIDRLYSEYVHTKAASRSQTRYYLERKIGQYESVSHLADVILGNVTSKLKEIGKITGSGGSSAFEEFILNNYEVSFLTNGIYAFHMQRWLKHFSSDQILVVNGETLMKKPWEVLDPVQDFLGIEKVLEKKSFTFDKNKGFYCIGRCLGRGKGRTRSLNDDFAPALHPPLSANDREILRNFYAPFNTELFNLLNKILEW